MRENNPHRKTKNVKDSDRQTREIHERFSLRIIFGCLLLHECRIGFPKTFFHSKIVREDETLLHEGKVPIFGVFFPKKI